MFSLICYWWLAAAITFWTHFCIYFSVINGTQVFFAAVPAICHLLFLSICSLFFNSRTAIAGAIGLLLVFFYFGVMIFVTTIWRHSHFLFIRSCNFNWITCVTSFVAHSGASFLFMRVIKFLVTLDLPHSQKWLPQFEIDFYLLQFKEIRSNGCVSL